jgi:predicted ribosome quality control (RQC) complex YloA/Tae2 family protein
MFEIGLFETKNKNETKPKVEKTEFKGYEIYIGKNNKQNDYLISKIAKDEDLWFHGQNFPSSHVILKIPNNKKEPDKEVLEYCAKLTKENSKAKNSTKAPIIMTKRKNLKKPPNTYLGYVTYKNEIEIVI